ncbi:uncharacterized protein Ecym_3379 [Eremothecium cymbalariae DBVPG|uniref:Uncharacterized protein n=1 Tax=Eremothecium cymbalariae (strain CBS 270.75 / DBVPG 7215 / KCTC 17166 / NRRL Y-17582) TaxID=931890 RepID=G8JRU7_ERECY|nr:Hypothetical protein Ecym_3379 [Eremothecium cymbalariae DBVPG\
MLVLKWHYSTNYLYCLGVILLVLLPLSNKSFLPFQVFCIFSLLSEKTQKPILFSLPCFQLCVRKLIPREKSCRKWLVNALFFFHLCLCNRAEHRLFLSVCLFSFVRSFELYS